jgi:hypothetical protein
MAENLTQYKAYPPLLALLQQHGLPKDAISHVTDRVAQIVAEALQRAQGNHAAAGESRCMYCCAAVSARASRKIQRCPNSMIPMFCEQCMCRMTSVLCNAVQGLAKHSRSSKQQHFQRQRLCGTCKQQMLSCKASVLSYQGRRQ